MMKTYGRQVLQNFSESQLINNFQKIMFKSQGGKFSSVFGTSKDKRNQDVSQDTGNLTLRKLLKYYLTVTTALSVGKKIPYLLQLMVAAQTMIFTLITDSSVNLTEFNET